MIFSACLVWAEPSIKPEVFVEQKLKIYGLGGMPWEETTALEEERSRAWMDALHHAYEDVLNLPLMEGKTVRHVFQTNSALRERLGMVLLSAPKTFYEADTTGLVRCRVEVPFNGKLSLRSALYLAALRPNSMKPVSFLASWSAEIKLKDKDSLPEFKRVVVDMRDTGFEPSLFPRFFEETGSLLFQEAMIPSPVRFSRPAVRFSTDIKDAYKDLKESEVMMLDGKLAELSTRDISVPSPEANIFNRFCKRLMNQPDEKREILVVFSITPHEVGKLSRKKEEVKDNKKK